MKSLLNFIPAKWKVRGEEKAKGEAQLALGGDSLAFWEQRLGWSPEAARYLATAFTFGVRENIATVLEKAQQLSDTEKFEEQLFKRLEEDPSIIGAALEASKFISTEELRDLLGRVLAGDVSKPGSVSRRAVSVAQDLTPSDLREFLKLRSATWLNDDPAVLGCLLILGPQSGMYSSEAFLTFGIDEIGVDFYTFGEFQNLGLIQERTGGLLYSLPENEDACRLSYGKRTLLLKPTGGDRSFEVGLYAFTKAGAEILSLFIDEEFPTFGGYVEEVCRHIRTSGLEVAQIDN